MNIYTVVVEKSTKKEVADLIKGMAEESEKYRSAFYAAKAFIDSNVADPDATAEMRENYDLYHEALTDINRLNRSSESN